MKERKERREKSKKERKKYASRPLPYTTPNYLRSHSTDRTLQIKHTKDTPLPSRFVSNWKKEKKKVVYSIPTKNKRNEVPLFWCDILHFILYMLYLTTILASRSRSNPYPALLSVLLWGGGGIERRYWDLARSWVGFFDSFFSLILVPRKRLDSVVVKEGESGSPFLVCLGFYIYVVAS